MVDRDVKSAPQAFPTASLLARHDAATVELRAELDRLRRQLDDGPPPLPPARRRGRKPLLGVLVVGGTLGAIATATLVPWSNLDPGHDSARTSAPATNRIAALRPLPAGGIPTAGPGITAPGSMMLVHVEDDGSLSVVEHAVLGPRGLREIRLGLPSTTTLGGAVAALRPRVTDLRVAVNGRPAPASARPDGSGWSVAATGQRARTVQLSYRLHGALLPSQRSDRGRALAVSLPLLAQSLRDQGLPMRVQASGGGLGGLTCPSAPAAQMLCGTETANGWTATVPAAATSPALLLQLNL